MVTQAGGVVKAAEDLADLAADAQVVVEHPGDWYTVYGQLLGWEIEKGQVVKKGDKIGTSRPKAGGGREAGPLFEWAENPASRTGGTPPLSRG